MYKPCIYTYRHAKMQVFPVEHGLQCRISQSQFACNAKVPVPFQCLLILQAIHCNSASSRTVSRLQLVCKYLLILLDEATTAVEASDSASSEDGRFVTKWERNKKLKRDLQEQDEETQRIQRLIDEATLRNKEKLKELAAVRNSYPVIVQIFFCFSCFVH